MSILRKLIHSPSLSSKGLFSSVDSKGFTDKATFAAGCFWGVEKAFQKQFKGEQFTTRVGYTGGIDNHPTYEKVCRGGTQHAEALQVEYAPSKNLGYSALVEFFYRMHDPTTLNAQGPDRGTQYRSAIFYHSPEQREIAHRVTAAVQEAHYKNKIVTEIVPAGTWFDAEDYHQRYLIKNPQGYECPSHHLRW